MRFQRIKFSFVLFSILFFFLTTCPPSSAKSFLKQKLQNRLNTANEAQYQRQDVQGEQPYYFETNAPVSAREQETFAAGSEKEEKFRRVDVAAKAMASSFSEQSSFDPNVFPAYTIYQADYKAELEEDVVTIKGVANFQIFRKGLFQIQLTSAQVGLIDVSLNKNL